MLGSPCEQPQLYTFFFFLIIIISIELNSFVTSRCCRSCCSRVTSGATAAAAGTYGWRPVIKHSVGKRTLMRTPAAVGSSPRCSCCIHGDDDARTVSLSTLGVGTLLSKASATRRGGLNATPSVTVTTTCDTNQWKRPVSLVRLVCGSVC